tara:strand:- start:1035 stop:1166 length:132 start_codon:yes stop_codon:yes gene_type:complete
MTDEEFKVKFAKFAEYYNGNWPDPLVFPKLFEYYVKLFRHSTK